MDRPLWKRREQARKAATTCLRSDDRPELLATASKKPSARLDYVDAQLGRMVSAIHKRGLAGSTTIIVTAKHGQSPQDPNELITVQDGPIISAINAAWAQTHPEQHEPDRCELTAVKLEGTQVLPGLGRP